MRNPFSAQKNGRITTTSHPQRREQRRFNRAENLEGADARAVNSESFRELSAGTACATIGPGC